MSGRSESFRTWTLLGLSFAGISLLLPWTNSIQATEACPVVAASGRGGLPVLTFPKIEIFSVLVLIGVTAVALGWQRRGALVVSILSGVALVRFLGLIDESPAEECTQIALGSLVGLFGVLLVFLAALSVFAPSFSRPINRDG